MHKQGDILLVPLPFSDLSSSKRRPVLVLSKLAYNNTTADLIVVAVTSKTEDRPYSIAFSNDDMEDGRLRMDSLIRADKIYTLSQDLIVKRFGKVKPDTVTKVKLKILELMDEK